MGNSNGRLKVGPMRLVRRVGALFPVVMGEGELA